jgi:hypothetical protein
MAVQIVYSFRTRSRSTAHIGSAHDEAKLELLITVALQRLAARQGKLGLAGHDDTRPAPATGVAQDSVP